MLIQPSPGLYERIINRLDREEQLINLKKKLISHSFSFVLSVIFFIPLTFKLWTDLALSGLTEFFSLMFTDFNIVMANINDYLFTILESVPTLSLALALTSLMALLFYGIKIEKSYVYFKKLNVAANSGN